MNLPPGRKCQVGKWDLSRHHALSLWWRALLLLTFSLSLSLSLFQLIFAKTEHMRLVRSWSLSHSSSFDLHLPFWVLLYTSPREISIHRLFSFSPLSTWSGPRSRISRYICTIYMSRLGYGNGAGVFFLHSPFFRRLETTCRWACVSNSVVIIQHRLPLFPERQENPLRSHLIS